MSEGFFQRDKRSGVRVKVASAASALSDGSLGRTGPWSGPSTESGFARLICSWSRAQNTRLVLCTPSAEEPFNSSDILTGCDPGPLSFVIESPQVPEKLVYAGQLHHSPRLSFESAPGCHIVSREKKKIDTCTRQLGLARRCLTNCE